MRCGRCSTLNHEGRNSHFPFNFQWLTKLYLIDEVARDIHILWTRHLHETVLGPNIFCDVCNNAVPPSRWEKHCVGTKLSRIVSKLSLHFNYDFSSKRDEEPTHWQRGSNLFDWKPDQDRNKILWKPYLTLCYCFSYLLKIDQDIVGMTMLWVSLRFRITLVKANSGKLFLVYPSFYAPKEELRNSSSQINPTQPNPIM